MTVIDKTSQRVIFWILLIGSVGLVLLALIVGTPSHGCLFPLAFISGLFTLMQGVRLRTLSQELSAELIEQQLAWMYGETWYKRANEDEIAWAEKRIRERRNLRLQFFIVEIPLFSIIAFGAGVMAYTFIKYNEPDHGIFLIIFTALASALLMIIIRTFPTSNSLKVREREYARRIDALWEMPRIVDKNKF